MGTLLLSFLALGGTLQTAAAGGIMESSSNSSDASDHGGKIYSGYRLLENGTIIDSGWVKLTTGTMVQTTSASTTSGSSSSSGSSEESSLSALDSSDVVETNGGQWVWSETSQKWEWVEKAEVNQSERGVEDSRGWERAPDGSFVRRTSSWSPWSSTSSRSSQQSRSSSSALDPSDVVETSRVKHNQGLRADLGPASHCEDYQERSPYCNTVGTYNCGLCKCPPDFFGTNCECSAEAIPFGFNLEDGCRCVKFFHLVH